VLFSASFDKLSKIISTVVCAILLIIALATQSTLAIAIGAAIVLVALAYSPRSYEVGDRAILVRRFIGNARIPLDSIREARIAARDDLRGAIRLWGNGGLFGYYGLFRTSRLGKCWWYLTNTRKVVIVVTGEKTALFSPDEPERFLDAIRATAPVPAVPGGSTQPQMPPTQERSAWVLPAIAMVVVLATAVVTFAFWYSPGPPSYTITAHALAIHDRFYPVAVDRSSIDLDHVRIVDLSTDAGWQPVTRTNGFANSHYRSGWFRVANGQTVRLYSAGGAQLVLLPPKGECNAILLQVAHPEDFLREIRGYWAAS
jgi:hypothetical protein